MRSVSWDAKSRPHLTRWFIANGANPNKVDERLRFLSPMEGAVDSFPLLKLLIANGGEIRRGPLLSLLPRTCKLETLDWLLGHGLQADGDVVP